MVKDSVLSNGKKNGYVFCDNIFVTFRNGPIPWTGCNKRFGGGFKQPKTHQEMKQSLAYPEFVRNKRKASALPNAWDDNYCTNILVKSWKRSKKKKQWM